MQDIPIDTLFSKTGSAYKLVILTARRAIELSDGASPLVKVRAADQKPMNIAIQEILEGRISYKIKGDK